MVGFSGRGRPRPVGLRISEPDAQVPAEPTPTIPWPLAAAGSAVVSAVSAWLVMLAITTIGWVSVSSVSYVIPISVATRLWLLAHGADVSISGVRLSLIPLGVTALIVVFSTGLAGFAGRQSVLALGSPESPRARRGIALRVGGVFGGVYAVCVAIATLVVGGSQTGRGLLGGLVLGLGSGLFGAGRAVEWRPVASWPDWARAIPRAIGAALLTMLAVSSVVLAISLLSHRSRVIALHNALGAGTAGSLLLLVLQLAWLPNLLIWCGSWSLGAGLGIGSGSIISPARTQVGLLPSVPVFGAIPANGAEPGGWLAWLLGGVGAGVVAALVIVKARRRARFDETALVGGLAGVAAGLCFWLLALLSSGALGTGHLARVGAQRAAVAILAPTLMGLAGLVTGLAIGLVRRPLPASGTRPGGRAEQALAETTAADG